MSDLGRYLAGILRGSGESMSVASPRPKRSVGFHRQPKIKRYRHINPVAVRSEAGWDQQIPGALRRGVAQHGTPAPNPEAAIGLDACGTHPTCPNFRPVRCRADL